MIRRMTPQDIDRVGEVWLEASIVAHDFVSADFWRTDYKTMTQELLPTADGYVHVTDNQLNGFITWKGDFVHCLFVQPESQRRGFGTSLLSRLQREHETLRLKVYQQNPGARAFYESLGFSVTGKSTCPYTGCAEFEMQWREEPEST
jgi:putative acetyltransferase